MITGKDIANFLTNETGVDYSSLYDESLEESKKWEAKKVSNKKNFESLMERMVNIDKRNKQDFFD